MDALPNHGNGKTNSGSILNTSHIRYILIVLSLVVVYGLCAIIRFPFFHTDDFLIFSYLQAHPSAPFCSNPMMDFYLFFRPLTYSYFWANYHLFGVQAIFMKLSGLLIFAVMTYFLYKILVLIGEEFDLSAKPFLYILGTLFFVFHPDMIHCLIWISNANELLMVFFYTLALYSLLKYKLQNLSAILLTSSLFLFALLSKQQSLHFILLSGLWLLFVPDKNKKNAKSVAVKTIVIGLVIIAAYIVINRFFITGDTNFSAYAWKKPFSLIGTLLYILFPPVAEPVYTYFITHKTIAIVVAITAAIMCGALFLRSSHKKTIVQFLLFFIVVFFPRVLAHGGDRVNSIQILWLSILLFYLVARYYNTNKIVFALFILLGCINFGTSIERIEGYIQSNRLQEKSDKEIIKMMQGNLRDYLIVVANDAYLLDYTTHFTQSGTFGRNNYAIAPFFVNNMLDASPGRTGAPDVESSADSNLVEISLLTPHSYLSIDKQNPLCDKFSILEETESDVGRGYKTIRCSVAPELQGLKKLYFDGQQWKRL